MELNRLIIELRKRLTFYRFSHEVNAVSKHINAIEISLCLVEYAIADKRPIDVHEQNWFEAIFQVSYILDGSDWQDLSDMYCQLVTYVKRVNYFR